MVPPLRRGNPLTVVAYACLLVVAWGVLELWGLGASPFYTKGEPREALVVWEMVNGGGWVLPKRNGIEVPSKPPLFHWLGALAALARGGADEWSVRFPSAAASLVGVLATFAAGASLWTPQAGLFSAVVLMTSFEWARAATNGRVDMTLTVGLLVAFLAYLFFLRRLRGIWLLPLYGGIAWAVLGKGPVGVVLPALVALVMVVVSRDIGPIRRMRLVRGTLAVAVVAGAWYVAAVFVGGQSFIEKQILEENVYRFFSGARFGGGHRHAAGYLLGALLLGLLPWTPWLAGVGVRLWRERRGLAASDPRVYLLVWIGVVFGFYAVAVSKRSVYLLALYPAVALLIGWWWDRMVQEAAAVPGWVGRVVAGIGWVGVGTVVVVAAGAGVVAAGLPVAAMVGRILPARAQGQTVIAEAILREAPLLLGGLLLLLGAALYGLTRAARHRAWAPLFAALACVAGVTLCVARQAVLPAVARGQSLKTFMGEVRSIIGPGGSVAFYRTYDYQAVFYRDGHIPIYRGEWPDDAPRYLIVRQDVWERLQPRARNLYAPAPTSATSTWRGARALVLLRRADAAAVGEPPAAPLS